MATIDHRKIHPRVLLATLLEAPTRLAATAHRHAAALSLLRLNLGLLHRAQLCNANCTCVVNFSLRARHGHARRCK